MGMFGLFGQINDFGNETIFNAFPCRFYYYYRARHIRGQSFTFIMNFKLFFPVY